MLSPDQSLAPIETPSQGGPLRVELVGEKQTCAEVQSLLQKVGDPQIEVVRVSSGELVGSQEPSHADVAIVIVDATTLDCLRAFANQTPRPNVLAALHERTTSAMRRALQAGADELIFLPLETGAVTRALLKINETRSLSNRESGGIICSVLSNSGGVGVTCLAANLALALRKKLEKRVAMIDLHLQAGDLPVFLNLDVHTSIMSLCEDGRQLDSSKLETALTKHSSGVYVLAAPTGIEESEVLPEATVSGALTLMRELFDFVVIDCGSYVDEKTVAVWERSDFLFYVVDQTVRSARGAGRFLDLYHRLGITQVQPSFVVNRYTSDHPIGEEHIIKTLGSPLYAKLPADKAALDRVEMRGQDLWEVAPTSALTRSIEELVRKITGKETGEKREPLFSRLFAGVSARA